MKRQGCAKLMEALLQIVGCVLSSRPAAELIDAFAAQVRGERAALLVKSAQGATFVRFDATDLKLIRLACDSLRGQQPPLLRFGFAVGVKETSGAGQDGLDISTRSVVQANDLAAGADDGEVLVSPQLGLHLIESGISFRPKTVRFPGGRSVPACSVDLGRLSTADSRPAKHTLLEPRSQQRAPARNAARPAMQHDADGLSAVFRALMSQAEEMARRQGELEARQDAVLSKMTLVDEGHVSARHLDSLESELNAQVARFEARLEFIGRLEQRVGDLQAGVLDAEGRLADQLQRHAKLQPLQGLCDTLVEQAAAAQHKLEGVAALQERLLPMTAQVSALAQSLAQSQRVLAAFEGRLGQLAQGSEALDQKIKSLDQGQQLVQAVKVEIDQIRQISSRSKADLQFVTERGVEVAELRARIEELLGRAQDTDDKIAAIESSRELVQEVQSRASTVANMLGDIQLKLELLDEQRAVIDHVGDQLARLDFTVQEAQNTLRALQREREVAERIEQGIKALRARSGIGPADQGLSKIKL
jgi:hypothetical protein